jgi:hypothetical protein
MTQPYARIGIVVAEAGASAKKHALEIRETGAELLVMKQGENELPEAFTRRCRERLGEITRTGACIIDARLVGGGGGRGERVPARAALVRLLVAPMARQGQGKLVLAGTSDDALSMKGLAAVVAEQVHGTGVTVTAEIAGAVSAIEPEAGADHESREARA